MNKINYCLLLLISMPSMASEHAFTFGGNWLDHSGINTLNLDRPENTLLTKKSSDTGLSLGYRWSGERIRLAASYQDHGQHDFTGESPDSNIFGHTGGVTLPVLTPFYFTSDLTSVNFDVTYLHRFNENWLFEVGPSLSLAKQDIKVTSDQNVLRQTSRSDNNLGLILGLQHKFSNHWQWNLQLRETPYGKLKVRQASLGLAYTF